MNFSELCREMYTAFLRGGHPGISGIADAGECWVFKPASEKPDVREYGLYPYFVDKNTGTIRVFNFCSQKDWDLIENAENIDVPQELKPKYAKR